MKYFEQLTNKLNESDVKSNKVVFDFFIVFARMEFALKNSGYVYSNNKNEQIALPDWKTFATMNNEGFLTNINITTNQQLLDAFNYIFENPPGKLKFISGNLRWVKHSPKDRTLIELLSMVKNVRNNLFHGSKRLNISEQSKDYKLIEYSLNILHECLEIDENIRVKFLEEMIS